MDRDGKMVSRRQAIGVAVAVVVTAASAVAGRAQERKSKARKDIVRYQLHPNGNQRCGDCANFLAATNGCQQVEGRIVADGWCRLWDPAQEVDVIPRREHDVPRAPR